MEKAWLWYDGRKYFLNPEEIDRTKNTILLGMRRGGPFWLDLYGPDADTPVWLLIGPGSPVAIHGYDDGE